MDNRPVNPAHPIRAMAHSARNKYEAALVDHVFFIAEPEFYFSAQSGRIFGISAEERNYLIKVVRMCFRLLDIGSPEVPA